VVSKQNEEKRKNDLSTRNMKACRDVSTALLQSAAEIGTQSAMKSSKKTLHEFTSHIPPKTPKRNISRSTNEMMLTDIIIVRAQGALVNNTHAKEATNATKIAMR
jgi:hypothetical protein